MDNDSRQLLAYLTARFGKFTLNQVENEIRAVFSEQYKLEYIESTETRYRNEERMEIRYDDGGNPYEYYFTEEAPYDWRVLTVKLTAKPLNDILSEHMTDEEKEASDSIIESGGNRQYVGNPLPFDWSNSITCQFGWRINPVTGLRDLHSAVDIAAGLGTPIMAAHDGTITTAGWHNAYGNYIVLTGENGIITKYAHCSQLLVTAGQKVKAGDTIAKVGSTGNSTGPHLHLEFKKDGEYLNPLLFVKSGA
jgi:murein DD-endopeptidase MepM/ murein hydrolase activator NlpD